MPVRLKPSAVVILDDNPASAAALELANRYTESVVGLASVEAGQVSGPDTVLRSKGSVPTPMEALEAAADRSIAWVGMRRDLLPPEELLQDLIIGTGKTQSVEGAPGFAVLLTGAEAPEFKRVLAIVDRGTGPVSGFMAFVATVVADKAQAHLDVLVLGSPGESIADVDTSQRVDINREQEWYDDAVARARESGVDVTWITVDDPADKWAVVSAQIDAGSYDLIIDEIGDLALAGGLRSGLSIEEALGPGQVGEISLHLLREVDINLLLVIDAVRLGLITSRMAKIGAVAAAALTIVAGGALISGVGRGATEAADASAAAPPADQAESVLTELAEKAEEVAAAEKRADKAGTSSRSATKAAVPAVKPVTAPKGGASATQAKKAKAAAAKAKAARDKAQKAADKAEAAAAAAEEELAAAQAELDRAQVEIDTARGKYLEAQNAADQAQVRSSGILGVLPGAPSEEEVAEAALSAEQGSDWLQGAIARGEEAVDAAEAAAVDLEKAKKAMTKAEATQATAKADYKQAREKADTYSASYEKAKAAAEAAKRKAAAEAAAKLAASRQSPLKSGTYNLSARYGQAGSAWSKGYHTGLDFAAPTGTNVYAAASGTVVETGWDGAYGNRIVISHGNGYYTTYNHLSSIGVSTGQKVTTGDKIGDVGNTGNSFGSHLHFEVTRGGDGWGSGSFVNPATWLGW